MRNVTLSLSFVVLGLLGSGCMVGLDEEREGAGINRCWGAWLDENGLCRTPADGVYPDECCAPQECDAYAEDPGCPEGQSCVPGACLMWCDVDDPDCCAPDTCQPDPICAPVVCALYCENGFQRDENGCEICACVEEQECPDVMCALWCPNGMKKDANGCDTCECADEQECPDVMCALWCPNGMKKDANGCDTCECEDEDTGHCGGFAGLQCDADEYCSYELDERCGAADHLGDCLPRPEVCAQVFDPVCGCDGQTYSSACHAAQSGVSVASEGACEPVDCRQEGCEDGEYCTYCWGNWACIPDGAVC